MDEKVYTIEDCLELCVGLQGKENIQLDPSDAGILQSIGRQSVKGTALTDRQYELIKTKLATYKDAIDANGYNFDVAVDNLRKPLREIDRTKYIKLVDTNTVYDQQVYESHKADWKWISVRFPFSKKLIIDLQSVAGKVKHEQYVHHRGAHEHFFKFTEANIDKVFSIFKDKDSFEIDPVLAEYYSKIEEIKLNKEKFIPGFFNKELCNLHPDLEAIIKEELEYQDYDEQVLKLVDRKRRYGIQHIDHNFNNFNLTVKIATREDSHYLSNPELESATQILTAIHELDRYPLIVVCSEKNAQQNLYEVFEFFKYLIPRESQSVMFRLDNTDEESKEFNQFIKDKKLNNWVDKSTKIVYINNKLMKTLFKSEFKPITALVHKDVLLNRQVDSYLNTHCDLIITRDTHISPMRRYSRYYGR